MFQVDSASKCIVQLPPISASAAPSASSDCSVALSWTSRCGVPLCCTCGRIARPSVVMFGDADALVLSLAQRRRQRYQEWEAAVEAQVESLAGAFRVVVLEVGCGTRVRSISDEAQCVHDDINAISSRQGVAPAATLIRVNPAADCPSRVDGSIVQLQGRAEEVTPQI